MNCRRQLQKHGSVCHSHTRLCYTLLEWVKKIQVNRGKRAGVPTSWLTV